MAINMLDRLASLVGIEEGWYDFFGHYRLVPEETKRTFLAAMGFAVGNDDELSYSLWRVEGAPWRRVLPPLVIGGDQGDPPSITVTLPAGQAADLFRWTLVEEQGPIHTGSFRPADLPFLEEREVDGQRRCRYRLTLPGNSWPGIHDFSVEGPGGTAGFMPLVITPSTAWRPFALEAGRKPWGYATQLYALKRPDNWGIGDFSDLARLGRLAGAQGAQAVGINPVHALFAAQPQRFSPYSPSSRLFIDISTIDVAVVPDFAESAEARTLFAAAAAELAALRAAPLIDHVGSAQVKRRLLEACWRSFRERHLADAGDARAQAFAGFRRQRGRALERFAIFEALQEAMLAADPNAGYWRQWPEELRDPDGDAVAAFAAAHQERIGFHSYLQWLADGQLADAQAACRQAGMALGVYRDLGVGIAGDGAEAWANQKLLCLGVSVGAPPDPLNLAGQDWGLVPFNPVALKDQAYQPFLDVLEANMRHAGAMRLDHAMSLCRLYWVPAGAKADQGAYVHYPMEEMTAIAALASLRQRCLLIGEDLGNVPDGFREKLAAKRILGYRLLAFEHGPKGLTRPEDLPAGALVGFGTHDLPSLAGWWTGIDMAERRALGLYPDEALLEHEEEQRREARAGLVEALVREGLLEEGFPAEPDLSPDRLGQLAHAVYGYLAKSAADLLMVQFEDVLGLALQMNLPGTVDQHPNWCLRYPEEIDQMLDDRKLIRLAEALVARDHAAETAEIPIESAT